MIGMLSSPSLIDPLREAVGLFGEAPRDVVPRPRSAWGCVFSSSGIETRLRLQEREHAAPQPHPNPVVLVLHHQQDRRPLRPVPPELHVEEAGQLEEDLRRPT